MSSRHDETIGRMPNPSQYYLEWNSEKNSFCYYTKETDEQTAFPLPFQFLPLKFMTTISGYDKDRKQGIYANEVFDTRLEHFRVKYRDGSHLVNGLYADIKDELQAVGGRYVRSIYAMTQKGKLVNIKLRGEQMINFGVIEKHGNRWKDEWIQVATTESKVYNEKPYTVPVFSFSGSLTQQEAKKADEAYRLVSDYFASMPTGFQTDSRPANRQQAAPAAVTQSAAVPAHSSMDDDLPF